MSDKKQPKFDTSVDVMRQKIRIDRDSFSIDTDGLERSEEEKELDSLFEKMPLITEDELKKIAKEAR